MSAKSDDVKLVSMNSGAESNKGVSDVRVFDSECKTLGESSGDKGILTDGARDLEDPKVLARESNAESVNSGIGWRRSGPLEIYDRSGGSLFEPMFPGGWSIMEMVGRALRGNFGDTEVDDKNTSKKGPGMDLLGDSNACQGVIAEPTSVNGNDVKGTVTDNDSDRVSSGCRGTDLDGNLVTIKTMSDGNALKGTKTVTDNESDRVSSGCEGTDLDGNLVTNKSLQDGKSEIEEANNAETDVLIPKGHGEKYITEKEGEYYVSDLVWGKVRSHPWWPGQIFAPTDASNEALKYLKRENHLIAYFGDNSFAWNEGSKIKPFRMYFSEMEKQSNAEGFSHAVNCALDEVSRRVEVGLSCLCVSQELRKKINTQVVINAGIREESRRREGGDNLYGAASFLPGELVQFLESLAEAPHPKPDRLQFTIMKSRLLAFNRWKGHYQLPVFEEHGGLLEDDSELTAKGEASDSQELIKGGLPGANDVPSKKRKLIASDGCSRNQNQLSGDERCPQRKEKCMSILMSSSLLNDNEEALKRTQRKDISSGAKRKPTSSAPSNLKGKRQKNILSPRTMSDMASQPKTFPRIGKCTSSGGGSSEAKPRSGATFTSHGAGKSQIVEMIPTENPSADEILSSLSLAAKNPMQGHEIVIPVVDLLCEFRNSICQENSSARNLTEDAGKEKENHLTNMESSGTVGFERPEDSYWTDRIIQSDDSQDQVLFEPETSNERTAELEPDIGGNVNLGINREGGRVLSSEEYCPTALILNFTKLEAIPSISNLNEIFSRYGPLNESETKILNKSKSARVIFKKRANAEAAFSSSGKYSIFGPSLIRYHLNYAPTPRKPRATISKRNNKIQP